METIGCAILRKESAAVRLYLENASEKAVAAVGPVTRRFYLTTESKWMDLVASTAVVGRMDLSAKLGISTPFVAL